jgi:hypothetical protein
LSTHAKQPLNEGTWKKVRHHCFKRRITHL